MSVSFVWYPAATYFPARGSHSAAWSFSVAGAPRTPCLTGSPVRFIVHRTRSQSIPSPALGCLTWPGKYILIKDQRKTPCSAWCQSVKKVAERHFFEFSHSVLAPMARPAPHAGKALLRKRLLRICRTCRQIRIKP